MTTTVDTDTTVEVLTIEEAAAILRISRNAAYAAARKWRATGGKVGSDKGFFYQPTVVAGARQDDEIVLILSAHALALALEQADDFKRHFFYADGLANRIGVAEQLLRHRFADQDHF